MEKADPDFARESLALDYFPYIRFSPLEYLTLVELYGDLPFGQLFPRLKDPLKLYPEWAIRFIVAAAQIPIDQLLATNDLYSLVTRSEFFSSRKKNRKIFRTEFYRVFERVSKGAIDIPEPLRKIYFDDLNRWRAILETRSSKASERKKERAEQKIRAAKGLAEAAENLAKNAKKLANTTENKENVPVSQPQKRKPLGAPVIIERKGTASSKIEKSEIRSSKGVWRNPHTQIVRRAKENQG